MDWQKGKNWNFEAATSKVTAEELPFLYFVKPLKDKPGFLQLHRDIFPRPENGGKSSFLEFCKNCAILIPVLEGGINGIYHKRKFTCSCKKGR